MNTTNATINLKNTNRLLVLMYQLGVQLEAKGKAIKELVKKPLMEAIKSYGETSDLTAKTQRTVATYRNNNATHTIAVDVTTKAGGYDYQTALDLANAKLKALGQPEVVAQRKRNTVSTAIFWDGEKQVNEAAAEACQGELETIAAKLGLTIDPEE